jgi:hypothetical protein
MRIFFMEKYRTFVKLDLYERWIVRVMQNAPLMSGKRRKIPASKVIGGIVREYFDDLTERADPQMLQRLLAAGPRCPVTLNDNVISKLNEVPPAGET